MRSSGGSFWRLTGGSEGASAVEFAIVLNIFFIMLLGMVEFGLAFSTRQVIVNASREGARYGIAYRADAQGNRILPVQLNPSIQNWILESSEGLGLKYMLPADANPTVTVTGAGAFTGIAGTTLNVTVSCNHSFWVINRLVPGLGDHLQLSATTAMRVE